MNTELTDRLRADMQDFTRDVRVPPGLALRAYRYTRKRRQTLRVAVASGAATAVAASAVAIAWVSGAFSPATTPTTQTTAYVVRHVENALAPASVGNLIGVSRVEFPPGITEQPVVGGSVGGQTGGGASSPWSVAYLVQQTYQGQVKDSVYSPSGQHVWEEGFSAADGSGTQTTVLYASRTWWTVTMGNAASRAQSPGCLPSGRIELSGGPGNGWPAFIRSQLACGAYTVAGRQEVDGIDAIKITAGQPPARLALYVNPVTYLPVQLTIARLTIDFQWLPATPANLALLKVAVPAGFRQVAPPARP